MKASELYQAGKLQDALSAQIEEVKADPVNPDKRLFLFTLWLFAGDLDKARRQLDAVKYGDIQVDAAVDRYKKLMEAEAKRRRLFTESLQPSFFMDAPESTAWRLDAINRMRENRLDEAASLVQKANEALPSLRGELNQKKFDGIRDFDDLFAGIVEVMAQGEYFWVPIEEILALGMNEPKTPRDLIYIPARLTLIGGQEGEVFLPALYPNTYQHSDDAVRLGRAFDVKQVAEGLTLGQGQRNYLVGEDAVGLLEWRQLFIGMQED
jgi:type VI secretion system protein ImpE